MEVEITDKDLRIRLEKADRYREALSASLPLSRSEEAELLLHSMTNAAYAYGALDGSLLSLHTIQKLLTFGISDGEYFVHDLAEAAAFKDAYFFAQDIARRKPFIITETDIRLLHEMLFAASCPKEAGKYRDVSLPIENRVVHPMPHMIPHEMALLVLRCGSSVHRMHPILWAIDLFLEILWIRPFMQGNARIAGLLLIAALSNGGYAQAVIPPVRHAEYKDALHAALSKDTHYFIRFQKFITDCVLEAQRDTMRILGIPWPEEKEQTDMGGTSRGKTSSTYR